MRSLRACRVPSMQRTPVANGLCCFLIAISAPALIALEISPGDDWQNVVRQSQAGAELRFLPGTFYGPCDFDIVENITLVGASWPTETSIIDCLGQSRHFHVQRNASLRVRGLTIRNGNCSSSRGSVTAGGCILLAPRTYLNLENVVLQGCTCAQDGGAIHAVQSILDVQNVVLQDCESGRSGGCVSVSDSTVSVSHTKLSNCTAQWHGGGIAATGSQLNMVEVHAEGNSAGDKGGAVYGGHGSVVSVSASKLERNRAGEFVGVRQERGYGGALVVEHGSSLTMVHDVLVTGNEADWAGGGVAGIAGSAVIIMGNCTLQGNLAGRRAGAAAMYSSHLGVHGPVTLAENGVGPLYTVGTDWLGGAITGEFSSATFTGGVRCVRNWAQSGGCIFGWGLVMEIGDDVHVNDNVAYFTGGAAIFYAASWFPVRIFNRVQINRNTAVYGSAGGLYLYAAENDLMAVDLEDEVQINDNACAWGGGALYLRWVVLRTRGKVELSRNVAMSDGGAIEASYEVDVALGTGCEIVDNIALRGAGIDVKERELFADGLCVVNASKGVRVEGNEALASGGGMQITDCEVNLHGVEIRGNTAGDEGGGLRLMENSKAVLEECVVEHNAAAFGGGVQLLTAALRLRGSRVAACHARVDGGGLDVRGESELVLSETAVDGCSAGAQGGGLSSSEAARVVVQGGVVVSGSAAGTRGGGMHLAGAGARVVGDGVRIDNNTAGEEGGGLSYTTEVVLEVGYTRVTRNTARTGGGLCGLGWRAEVRVEGDRLEVDGNVAEESGGGVALVDLARLSVSSTPCAANCEASDRLNNTFPNFFCFSPECNFDEGDFASRFERAGDNARLPCNRAETSTFYDEAPCHIGAQEDGTVCHASCFTAQCDWSEDNPVCADFKAQHAACPIWDAVTLDAIERDAPDLVYVEPGGTARGFGRCGEACRPGPSPALPAWCSEPACNGSEARWSEAAWCGMLDDDGLVVETDLATHYGAAWGVCGTKKLLPFAGLQYDREELLRSLQLSLPDLLREYPACGAVPLEVRGNKAGRNGGGLWKSSCSLAPHLQDGCFVGGVSGAMVINIEGNSAGAAGGGAFVECHKVGECGNVVAIPRVGAESLLFTGNVAQTFGSGLASAATHLRLVAAEGGGLESESVPGKSTIAVTFELVDALGQRMRAEESRDLPGLVSFAVCAMGGECGSAEALQAVGYTAIKAGAELGFTADAAVTLRYCELGQSRVRVRLELVGSSNTVAGQTAKETLVSCQPCQPWERMEVVQQGGRQLWTCSPCDPGQYVVNVGGVDPVAQCLACPIGAECVGGNLLGRVEGSVWRLDETARLMRLVECPEGYQLVNSLDGSDVFAHSSQQCRKCEDSQYILNYTDVCRQCPVGGRCEGGQLHSRVPGSEWRPEDGWLRLVACPAGYVLFRLQDAGSEASDQCVICPEGKYSAQPASYSHEGLSLMTTHSLVDAMSLCLDCPEGAHCSGGQDVTPQPNYWRYDGSADQIAVRRAGAEMVSHVEVFPCPAGACKGGADNACETGREGPVCGVCKAGFVMSNSRCIECDQGLSWFGRSLYILIALAVLAAYCGVVIRPLLVAHTAEATESAAWQRLMAWVAKKKQEVRHLQLYLKVVTTFFQLLSSFLFTFSAVNWSRGNVEVMSYSSVASLNLLAMPGPSCVTGDISYEAKLVMYTTFPLLVLALLVVPGLLFATFSPHRHETVPGRDGVSVSRRREALDGALQLFLAFLFLIFPMATHACLKNFLCQPLWRDLRLLKADYTIECPNDSPSGFIFAWSVAFGALYVIGIPAVFYCALRAYSVPQLARRKLWDGALYEMIVTFKKKHCHDLDSLLILLGLNVAADSAEAAEESLQARCAELYAELSADRGRVDVSAIAKLMEDTGTTCIQPEALAKIVASQAGSSDAELSEVEFVEVFREVVRENSIFSGAETFGALDETQVRRLLSERWNVSRAEEDAASADHSEASLVQLKETLLTRIDRLQHVGTIPQGPAEWDGETPDEAAALERVGFLFHGYRVGMWHWEIVELLRKVIFTGFLPFIYSGSRIQLTIGFLLNFAFLLVTSRVRPFKDARVEKVYAFANAALCLTLFYGHVIVGGWPRYFQATLGVLNIVVDVLVLGLPLLIEFLLSSSSPILFARRLWLPALQDELLVAGRSASGANSTSMSVFARGSTSWSNKNHGQRTASRGTASIRRVASMRVLQHVGSGAVALQGLAKPSGKHVAGQQGNEGGAESDGTGSGDADKKGSGGDTPAEILVHVQPEAGQFALGGPLRGGGDMAIPAGAQHRPCGPGDALRAEQVQLSSAIVLGDAEGMAASHTRGADGGDVDRHVDQRVHLPPMTDLLAVPRQPLSSALVDAQASFHDGAAITSLSIRHIQALAEGGDNQCEGQPLQGDEDELMVGRA